MSLLEFTAVEHFAHALAAPADGVISADIEARAAAMERAVDEVIARYAPTPGMSDTLRVKTLKVVDGLLSMMSTRIDGLAANIDQLDDPARIETAIKAHDDTVRHYYRLIALRSDLDPDCRPTGEVLSTPEELSAWFDSVSVG